MRTEEEVLGKIISTIRLPPEFKEINVTRIWWELLLVD
jgi:hypothetical protein